MYFETIMNWGKVINHYLHLKDWKQVRLSQEAGIPESNISTLMTGKRKPTLRQLEKIADAFCVPLSQLFAMHDGIAKTGEEKNSQLIEKDQLIAALTEENAQLKRLCGQIIQIIRTTQSLLPDVDSVEREFLARGKP